ncbi:MAG: hypothetical protein K5786_12160 [Treponema sp.]|nr:hypothetical protein [Treponema sp.]
MIIFKGKKYAIPEETAISWLKSVHFQLAKPLAEKMELELPEDFVSDNAGKKTDDFGSLTYEEALKKGEDFIAMHIKWALRDKARRPCSLKQEYVYIVTSYERGDDYSAFAYAAIDKDDAISFVENEQKKWTEGWASHTFLWRCKLGLWGGEKILWGIYSVEKGEWLSDYSVDENETIFFEDQVLVKAPYSNPNTGILVCPMVVKDGRRSFTILN